MLPGKGETVLVHDTRNGVSTRHQKKQIIFRTLLITDSLGLGWFHVFQLHTLGADGVLVFEDVFYFGVTAAGVLKMYR